MLTPTAVAVDGQGKVVVVSTAPGDVSMVHAFDASGAAQWNRSFGGDPAVRTGAVRFTSTGSILLAGETRGALDGQPFVYGSDVFLRGLAADGTWSFTWMDGTNRWEGANALAIDAQDRLYMAGRWDAIDYSYLMRLTP